MKLPKAMGHMSTGLEYINGASFDPDAPHLSVAVEGRDRGYLRQYLFFNQYGIVSEQYYDLEDEAEGGEYNLSEGLSYSVFATLGAAKACLVGETNVRTKDGLKAIKDMVEGDIVLDKDGNETKVIKTTSHKDKYIYTFKLSDGSEIKATDSHKIQ